MRIPIRGRAASAAVAVAIAAGGLVAIPLAMPASSALKQSVECSKLASVLVAGKSTSTLSGCTPAALKAGATSVTVAPPAGSQSGTVGSKLTWKGGKGTTTLVVKFVLQKQRGNCPAGTTRINATGTVKIVTGAAKSIIKVGEPFTATVCAFVSGPNAGKTQLAPGTKYKL